MNVKFKEMNLIRDSIARKNEISIRMFDSLKIVEKQRFDSLKVDFLRLEQFKTNVSNATAENKKHWVRENWLRVSFMAGFVATFVKIITAEPKN